ncbi:MAG TPA: ABC transporter substrate-binding protein [Alphaproteobacteria bacterium]|nr:ABC transporter substrate-binding protein [Alphaproteobacteria bacterium]
MATLPSSGSKGRTGRRIAFLFVVGAWLALGACPAIAQAPAAGPARAEAEPRVALVIGNGAYRAAGVHKLKNPVNDARAMAKTLRELGFKVIEVEDADLKTMQKAFVEFSQALPRNGAALFYYAGHGMQLKGLNYLLPVDAAVEIDAAIPFETFPMEVVTDQLDDAHARVALVILDACRDSPFGRGLRGISGGLAAIDAARGTLIAYATAPGAVAEDGDSGHGLYTLELLSAIKSPGLDVEQVFKKVRAAVVERSGGKQVPWESSSLIGEFFFVPPGSTATMTPPPSSAPSEAPEMMLWSSVKDSGDPALLQTYLDQFPHGTFAGAAKIMIEKLKRSQTAALPPKPEAVPAPAASAAVAIEEIEGAYITVKRANIREKPLTDAKLIKTLEPGVPLTVTGRVKDTGWYRVVSADDKLRGFVFGDAIQDMKAAEEAEWQRVKDAKESGLVDRFLKRYPAGAYANEAKGLREALTKAEKQAIVVPSASAARPSDESSKMAVPIEPLMTAKSQDHVETPGAGTPVARIPPDRSQSEIGIQGKGGGDPYLNALRDAIVRNLTYPALAHGRAGIAKYEMVMDRQGVMLKLAIVQSTGSPDLDRAGMDAVQKSAPFDPPPAKIIGDRIGLQLTLYIGPNIGSESRAGRSAEPEAVPAPALTPGLGGEIMVATAGPMSGNDAAFGEQMKKGAEMAVRDINAAGGVLGRKLRLEVGDDQCDPRQAVPVAQSFVRKGVIFVAGHYCSGDSIPASAVYVENNILQITPASTNPMLTDSAAQKGWKTVFRTSGRDDQQGIVAGNLLASHYQGRRIAILDDQSPYGAGIANQTKRSMNEAGVQETLRQSFQKGDRDFTALVSRMKQMGIDVVYVGSYHTETGLMVKQAADQGFHPQWVSEDALVTDEFWKVAGPAGEGLIMTFPPDPRVHPAAKAVVAEFRQAGYDPLGYTLYTYAAFQVWAQAVKAAGTTDAQSVAATLRKGTYNTVLGTIQYDDKGDRQAPGYIWYRWHDGRYAQTNL